MIETNKEKYGVSYSLQNKVIHQKAKDSMYNTFTKDEISNKRKNTMIKKYGVEYPIQNPEIKEKTKNTNITKYGANSPLEAKEIKDKIKNTLIEKYGVKNPLQSSEIQEQVQKTSYKFKNYTMPSGQIRKIQGYEHFAMDELVKVYDEDNIKTVRSDVPRIKYTLNNKIKYYFPDIYIPQENKLLEIKSEWTYTLDKDKNIEKFNACKEMGYNFEVWIYNSKGNKNIIIP